MEFGQFISGIVEEKGGDFAASSSSSDRWNTKIPGFYLNLLFFELDFHENYNIFVFLVSSFCYMTKQAASKLCIAARYAQFLNRFLLTVSFSSSSTEVYFVSSHAWAMCWARRIYQLGHALDYTYHLTRGVRLSYFSRSLIISCYWSNYGKPQFLTVFYNWCGF
jgi:hypothetical protein